MPRAFLFTFVVLAGLAPVVAADTPAKRTAKEALQPFQLLVGSWRGTGLPEGNQQQRQRGFWQEVLHWEWQFKGDDAWLQARIDKGKYYTHAELRYLPGADGYRLTLKTVDRKDQVFEGKLEEKRLTVGRTDDATGEKQQITVSLLHDNRFLYRFDVQPKGKTGFRRVYQVGATKEGVAFATGSGQPECIVSGGLGTMPVMYKGKTYYVCCSGCRDAFNDEPEKYIREYAENLKKKREGDR